MLLTPPGNSAELCGQNKGKLNSLWVTGWSLIQQEGQDIGSQTGVRRLLWRQAMGPRRLISLISSSSDWQQLIRPMLSRTRKNVGQWVFSNVDKTVFIERDLECPIKIKIAQVWLATPDYESLLQKYVCIYIGQLYLELYRLGANYRVIGTEWSHLPNQTRKCARVCMCVCERTRVHTEKTVEGCMH